MPLWPVILIALSQADPLQPRFERLDNGLRVVIVEDHALPLVSVQLWCRVGSADDPPGKPGLCAVARSILEHRDDAALKLRAAGVRFESRTLRDACHFSSVLPPNFLDYVLTIEAARMRPLATAAEMLERGLNVAARAYAQKADDPNHVVLRHALAAMFPDHPYQHPPGFVAASLKGLSTGEVNEFLERWFVPGNATLFVIGDVSTVNVLEQVRQRFGGLEWAEPPRRAEPPRLPAETIRISIPRPNHAGITVAWRTPPLGYFENAAIDVLMQRLCNPVDGPLCRQLMRMQCRLPRWKRCAWRDAGLLTLCITPTDDIDQQRFSEIEAAIEEQITKAAGSVPSEIEHTRARALAGRDVLNHRAGFGDRARVPAEHEMVAGDLLLAEFQLTRAAHVGVADVQRAAIELAGERTAHLLLQKTTEKGPDTTPEQPVRLAPAHHARLPEQLDGAAALELLANHAAGAPPIESPKSPGSVTTHQLEDRVTITVCRIAGLKSAEVRTLLTADPYVAPAMSALLAAGSTKHTVDQFRDYLSYHGLDLYPLARGVRPGLVSRGPATHVPQMIELQAELIRFSNRSDSACADATRGLRRANEIARAMPRPWQDRLYVPPGVIGWRFDAWSSGSPRQVADRLKRLDEIQAIEVLVVGDVEPEPVREAVRQAWEPWRPVAKSSPVSPPTETQPAPEPYTSCHWFVEPDQQLWLRIEDSLYPPILAQPARELASHCVAWTLGGRRLLPATLGARHAWLWTWDFWDEDEILFSARPTSDEAAPHVESWLDRMRQLQHGELPRSEVETALRLARADRLTSLGSPAAIADLLERGVANPWDLLDDHGPAQFLELIPQAYRVHMRSISGTSPEDRSEELKRFDSWHD